MREYPIGSVCTIIRIKNPDCKHLLHKECTIKDRLKNRAHGMSVNYIGYEIRIQGQGDQIYFAEHDQLRLKKFPPDIDAFCRKKIKTLLNGITREINKEPINNE